VNDEVTRWVDRLGGALAGLALGLTYSVVITWNLVKLGGRMGTEVMRAARLSAHVSREYQNLKRRVERLERRSGGPLQDDIEEGGG